MVKVQGKGGRGKGGGGGGKGGGKGGGSGNQNSNVLKTQKGTFAFTMVADGCYIEHKWGTNSGHVGVPLEAIPGFIQKLQALYTKTTGQKGKKSRGGGPKATITKGGKKKTVKPKEKKKPEPKKSTEDLDNELMNYTAERGTEPAAVEPAPIS